MLPWSCSSHRHCFRRAVSATTKTTLVVPAIRTSESTRVDCDCGGGGGVKDVAMVVLIAQTLFSARSFGYDEDNFGRSCHPHI